MADYIYLLENRLSEAQRNALGAVREVARAKGLTLFLVGGAVRDLTSGSPVRDLDVVVQGNALKLRKDLELAGATVAGSSDSWQALFARFPGSVRMEVGSTITVTYPKPGKAVVKPATILEDLRRRDFTANAMALSLNEGSYGLLMDPLNGVADIENRELRLVSNYGFIEDPVRMIRGTRFAARLGWEFEEKTRTRYETGKQEGYIGALQEFARGYEAEEIVHEEDPLRVIRRLEAEGWMQVVAPGWTAAKANVAELEKVRESQTQMQMQGLHPDAAAVNFPLLTAKMSAKEVEALKKSFPRQGFVAEIDRLEAESKEFAGMLGGKGAGTPSAAFKLISSAKPEAVLYVAYTTKSAALQAKMKSFFGEWQQARQKIPYALMQEMRIVPEVAGYGELVERLFFELMDGRLGTVEEMKAFLEPFSPPAPPPPVHLRRARSSKKDAKGKGRAKKGVVEIDDSDDADDAMENAGSAADEDEEPGADNDFGGPAELAGGTSGGRVPVAGGAGEDDDPEEDEPFGAGVSSGRSAAAVASSVPAESERMDSDADAGSDTTTGSGPEVKEGPEIVADVTMPSVPAPVKVKATKAAGEAKPKIASEQPKAAAIKEAFPSKSKAGAVSRGPAEPESSAFGRAAKASSGKAAGAADAAKTAAGRSAAAKTGVAKGTISVKAVPAKAVPGRTQVGRSGAESAAPAKTGVAAKESKKVAPLPAKGVGGGKAGVAPAKSAKATTKKSR